jgi:hypothetical protein
VYLCVRVFMKEDSKRRRRERGGGELVSVMCRVWWGTDFSSPGSHSPEFGVWLKDEGKKNQRIKE